jgi:hypothetical protein
MARQIQKQRVLRSTIIFVQDIHLFYFIYFIYLLHRHYIYPLFLSITFTHHIHRLLHHHLSQHPAVSAGQSPVKKSIDTRAHSKLHASLMTAFHTHVHMSVALHTHVSRTPAAAGCAQATHTRHLRAIGLPLLLSRALIIIATTIVASANAVIRPIVFKPTRPLRAPSRLSATASLHFPNIGSTENTELCARHRTRWVIGFTRAEQCRPRFGELALERF